MKEVGIKITKYILMFMLASFIGWAYEITCVLIIYGRYNDRGILHLPFCPIYGFGILILYCILRKVKNSLLIFSLSTLITTSVELITSYVAEYKFRIILWTYEGWPLNYQNRISLVSSCIFGLMALLFFKLIRPMIEKIYGLKCKIIIGVGVIVLFVICAIWELYFYI